MAYEDIGSSDNNGFQQDPKAKYTAKAFHNFKSKIHFEYPTVAQQVTKFFAFYTN